MADTNEDSIEKKQSWVARHKVKTGLLALALLMVTGGAAGMATRKPSSSNLVSGDAVQVAANAKGGSSLGVTSAPGQAGASTNAVGDAGGSLQAGPGQTGGGQSPQQPANTVAKTPTPTPTPAAQPIEWTLVGGSPDRCSGGSQGDRIRCEPGQAATWYMDVTGGATIDSYWSADNMENGGYPGVTLTYTLVSPTRLRATFNSTVKFQYLGVTTFVKVNELTSPQVRYSPTNFNYSCVPGGGFRNGCAPL
jgi:hypothetical protein